MLSRPKKAGKANDLNLNRAVAYAGPVATFTDPGLAEPVPADFTATIDWGDGSAPESGSVVDGAIGGFDVTGTHTYDNTGVYTITVTVADVDNETASLVMVGSATVIEGPAANEDRYRTPVDQTLYVSAPGVLANDSDPEYSLTAVLVSNPSHGSLSLDGDGSFSYTPDSGFNGVDSFTYVANNGSADSNEATVWLIVGSASTETTLESSSNPSVYGEQVTFTATVSGFSPAWDTPTGTVAFYADSELLGSGALDEYGVATLHVFDLNVGSHSITAEYQGDPIFGTSISESLTQVIDKSDTTTSVTSDQAEPTYGTPITFTAAVEAVAPGYGTPTGAVTFLDDGSAIGTGTLDEFGIATFTTSSLTRGTHTITARYEGDDFFNGSESSLSQTVYNNPPVGVDDSFSTDEDVQLSGNVGGNDSDIDGDTLSFILDSGPSNGTVNLSSDGSFTFMPTENFNGADSFTYTVSDGQGGTDTATALITVNAVNDNPTLTNPGSQTNAEGESPTLTLSGSDPDGDTLSWSASGLPSGLSIDGSGTISGTLPYDAAGNYMVTVTATDGNGGSASVTFDWTVTNTNRDPSLTNPGAQTSAEGDTVSVPISGSDPDGDTLSWSASGLPDGLSIDSMTGAIGGTLSFDAAGTYSVTVTASDGNGGSASVTFDWTVTNTNRDPSLTNPGDQWSSEGDMVSVSLSGSDPDGDTLSWSASGLPDGLSIDSMTGTISGTLSFESAGTYSVTVTASDGNGGTASVTFTWTITNVNRDPTIDNPGDQWSLEGDTVSLSLTGSDPDGDTLNWSASGLPDGLSIDSMTGTIGGTLSFDAAGTYSVTVTASDGNGGSASVTFTWTVSNVNRDPTIDNPGDQWSLEGDSVSLSLTGSDPDGDTLSWSASGLPDGLSIDSMTGTIGGTLSFDAAGTYSVTVTATDGNGGSASASVTFTWTVSNVNRDPTIDNPGDQWSSEGDTVSLSLSGSDPDGDTLSWSASGLPDGLSIDSMTGTISGTLSYESAGFWIVTVTASDGNGGWVSVTFNWTIDDA